MTDSQKAIIANVCIIGIVLALLVVGLVHRMPRPSPVYTPPPHFRPHPGPYSYGGPPEPIGVEAPVVLIEAPDGGSALGKDVSESGDVLVADSNGTGHKAYIWSHGELRYVADMDPIAFNAHGDVCGTVNYKPAVVRAGALSMLACPANTENVVVTAINPAGDVLGDIVVHPTGTKTYTNVTMIWHANGTSEALSAPGCNYASATSYDAAGRIVGTVGKAGSREAYACIWTGAQVHAIGPLQGDTECFGVTANGDNVLCLSDKNDRSHQTEFWYSLKTGQIRRVAMPDPDRFDMRGYSLVPGCILGAEHPHFDTNRDKPAFAIDGAVTNLSYTHSGWAFRMNGSGEIVGSMTRDPDPVGSAASSAPPKWDAAVWQMPPHASPTPAPAAPGSYP